jgi:hypothetical protein
MSMAVSETTASALRCFFDHLGELRRQQGARYFARVATGIITKALKDSAQGGLNQLGY